MTAQIRIGTAGWSIASRNADLFPSSGSQLQRYCGRFDATEINSSFHRHHRRATYERWAEATPPDFSFSVKLPREITHDRRLVDCEGLIDRFAGEIEGLGDRLGPVLVQLPPSLTFDAPVAERLFNQLQARLATPLACEPRHPSWFSQDAEALLMTLHVARVAADPARRDRGDRPGGWSGLAYWRWHGSPRVYFSPYGPDRLAALGRCIRDHRAPIKWVVFDNTASSAAARDAAELQSLLSTS